MAKTVVSQKDFRSQTVGNAEKYPISLVGYYYFR